MFCSASLKAKLLKPWSWDKTSELKLSGLVCHAWKLTHGTTVPVAAETIWSCLQYIDLSFNELSGNIFFLAGCTQVISVRIGALHWSPQFEAVQYSAYSQHNIASVLADWNTDCHGCLPAMNAGPACMRMPTPQVSKWWIIRGASWLATLKMKAVDTCLLQDMHCDSMMLAWVAHQL